MHMNKCVTLSGMCRAIFFVVVFLSPAPRIMQSVKLQLTCILRSPIPQAREKFVTAVRNLAHQNRTIAIASDFRVEWVKSPEIPQKEGVLGSEIAARNRKSLATFHRTLKSQCCIAFSCLGNSAISGVCDGHRNRKSQKSRCAKVRKLLT